MASPLLIQRLRRTVGDEGDPDARIWSDAQLGEFIEQGFSEYTYGARDSSSTSEDDITQSMRLAHSFAMYELASNTALFFRWRDQNKEIDKSQTPEMARRIGKDLWEQVMKHRESKDKGEGVAETKKPQGGIMQFDPGARTTERAWR